MWEQFLAAVFVIGLLAATLWALRRKGFAVATPMWKKISAPNSMQLIERLALTTQHSLHLVRVGDQVVLIGLSPSSCGLIMTVGQGSEQLAVKRAI